MSVHPVLHFIHSYFYIYYMRIQFKSNYVFNIITMKLAVFKRHAVHYFLDDQQSNKYDLSFADFADEELEYLTTLYLQHMVELNLSYNQIGLRFCIEPNMICWKSLQNLNLNNNLIEGKGVKLLLQVEMAQLDTLSLSNNRLNDNSLRYLSKNRWRRLRVANFSYNKISDEGVKMFLSFDWKNLKSLYLQQNWIVKEGIKWLLLSDWPNMSKMYCYHEHLSECSEDFNQKQSSGTIQRMLLHKFGENCEIHL